MTTDPTPSSRRSVNHTSRWHQCLLWPLAKLALLWGSTLRVRIDPESERILRNTNQPLMLILWHNRLFFVSRIARQFRSTRRVKGLISASQDGALLEAFFRHVGIGSIRGSSSWRGTQSIRELVHAYRAGYDLGITPDGPRGPAYECKPGIAILQRLVKAKTVLIGVECNACWRLNSWDRFILPKPFSTITIRMLEADSLFPADRTTNIEAATEQLTNALRSINPEPK